jgi:hypothetical protein
VCTWHYSTLSDNGQASEKSVLCTVICSIDSENVLYCDRSHQMNCTTDMVVLPIPPAMSVDVDGSSEVPSGVLSKCPGDALSLSGVTSLVAGRFCNGVLDVYLIGGSPASPIGVYRLQIDMSSSIPSPSPHVLLPPTSSATNVIDNATATSTATTITIDAVTTATDKTTATANESSDVDSGSIGIGIVCSRYTLLSLRLLKSSMVQLPDAGCVSHPRHVHFPTRLFRSTTTTPTDSGGSSSTSSDVNSGGKATAPMAHGLFYPPRNAKFQGESNALPPLLVKIHGQVMVLLMIF